MARLIRDGADRTPLCDELMCSGGPSRGALRGRLVANVGRCGRPQRRRDDTHSSCEVGERVWIRDYDVGVATGRQGERDQAGSTLSPGI